MMNDETNQDLLFINNSHDNKQEGGILHRLKSVIELPDVWKRSNSYLLNKKKQKKSSFFSTTKDRSLESFDILLPNQMNDFGPLLSQTIYKSEEKQGMTFSQIQSKLRPVPDSQTIKSCLTSHSYFKRVRDNKKTYWQADEERLQRTHFGQHLIDTGMLGGFEYWNGVDKPTV